MAASLETNKPPKRESLLSHDHTESAEMSQADLGGIVSSKPSEPFSVFTAWEKRAIVGAASLISFLSPLTANIYLPILHTIADDLDVGNTQVNLTVTVYLVRERESHQLIITSANNREQVIQAVAPIFLAPLSDTIGRRPICIFGLVIYVAANLGLAIQFQYSALLGLRCLQSFGTAALTTIGGAVVADCVVPAERGAYIGFTMIGPILGPSLSPVLGGALSNYSEWRVTFWVLGAAGAVALLLTVAFLPETCRNVVGNGSYPVAWYQNSFTGRRVQQRQVNASVILPSPISLESKPLGMNALFGMWAILSDLRSFLIIAFSSIVSAGYWCITMTIASEYARIYGFDDFVIGLCFLPIAGGGLLVAVMLGSWDPVDGNYRRHAKKLGIILERNQRHLEVPKFPIERVRLEVTSPLLLVSCGLVVGYGWALETPVSVACPLALLFAIGFCMMGMGKTIQLLLMDIHPLASATAVAAFNVSRSLLGAGMTAASGPMINTMGNGWTFTTIGSSWSLFFPVILFMQWYGPRLRTRQG